jgi:TolB protein
LQQVGQSGASRADEDRSEVSLKKWIIVGVTIAAFVLLVGIGAYALFHQTWSAPDMVQSLEPLPGVADACNASWSPDGSAILYATSLKEGRVQKVYKVGAEGGNQVCLGEGRLPVWSPDASRIAVVTDNGLEVMDADGGERSLLADLAEIAALATERQLNATAWSPDGSMIAFEVTAFVPDQSLLGKNADTSIDGIWLVNADGSSLRQLAKGAGEDSCLVWSPDSQRIAFVSYGNGGKWDVWVSRVDGSDLRQLTASNELEFDMAWSPDGSKLAFASHGWPGETGPGILVMDVDGANKTQLTEGSGRPGDPVWSPDGSLLAFSSAKYGGDIWIVNADGTGKTRLTKTSTSRASSWFTCGGTLIRYREPQWSPDGAKLLFLNSLHKSRESWGETRTTSWGYDRLWVMELDLENGLS